MQVNNSPKEIVDQMQDPSVYDLNQKSVTPALPIEVFLEILKHIGVNDLPNVCLVSREWKFLTDDESLWRFFCLRDFSLSSLDPSVDPPAKSKETWKQTYPFLEKKSIEFTFPDGKVWIGVIKHGTLNGQGTIKIPVGEFLEGEFDIEEGVFKNGLLNGKGCSIHLGAKQQGEFKNGKLDGPGKSSSPDEESIAEGEFREGYLNGEGTYTFWDGTIFEGEFRNDMLNGQGKITFADGETHEGEFKNGLLNGRGKIVYSDGYVEEGEFRDNILIPLHYDT